MTKRWISFIAAAFIAVAAVAPAVAQEDDTITVNLEEVDGSGYSGTAELSSDNGQTTVSIDLEVPADDDENGTLTAGIHEGTCDDIGDEAYELEDIENGSSESTVDVSLDELQTEEYVIAVHSDDGLLNGDAVACGEITAAPMAVEDDDEATDDEDAAIVEDDDDEATDDEDAAIVEDDDEEATDDQDTAVVDEDDDEDLTGVGGVDPAAEDDDTEAVAPATGSVPSGTEAAILMMTLLGAAALGVGFLVRRRAFQA